MASNVLLTITSTDDGDIDRERIVDGHLVPEEYFCTICKCLLWKPCSCASCQHLFCQKCIRKWTKNTPSANKCPFRCQSFEERRCPPSFHSLLARLNIHCRNTEFDCTQVLSYNSLEHHENIECEYLTQRCSECEHLILVSKLNEHRETPGLCVPGPIKCTICQSYIDKSAFFDHSHQCWDNRAEELLEETCRRYNGQTQMNNQPTETPINTSSPLTQNWLNFVTSPFVQGRMSQLPSTLIGSNAVKEARQRNCGFFIICL